MNRSDTLRAISAKVRNDQWAALWAVGYLLMEQDQETLENLLSGLTELSSGISGKRDHRAAYEERWGVVPPR